MAEPVLDGPGIVPGVRQCVAAAMAEHVGVDREGEARALPNAFNQAIDRVTSDDGGDFGVGRTAAAMNLLSRARE
jgi:hypothetical protein